VGGGAKRMAKLVKSVHENQVNNGRSKLFILFFSLALSLSQSFLMCTFFLFEQGLDRCHFEALPYSIIIVIASISA
jgi:hypothetical protein